MKTLSSQLVAHIAGEVTTLATCWHLTRRDGTVMGFTDHHADIILDDITYTAATGFTPTAVASTSGLAVNNMDVQGMLESSAITEQDILAGLYDFAELEVFVVNYTNLSQGIMILKRGWLGEVTLRNHQFTAEVRGLSQNLAQPVGELFSPSCRANLGDTRCKVEMEAYTITGTITSVTSTQQFKDTGLEHDSGYFDFGVIQFTSGDNVELSMEVKNFTQGGSIILALPMPYPIQIGDTFSLRAGCDKTLTTCKTRFTNAINFRGEPSLPGIDRMLQTSTTRTEWA